MEKAFLIKYAEIGIKGKNRYMFEDALMKQIRFALEKADGTFEVTKEQGRIYVIPQTEFDPDDAVEAMKKPYLGKNGHIAIGTTDVEKAVEYLKSQGVEFDMDTAKYKNDKITAVYIKEEIGGFAVHLVQK